ncbi:MAG: hypothetical protein HOP12_12480, partial [Candidatus Eisenbacteria bacterium]|nr:hypothetical protein [Candidatus Eisenbacteria bacterium]
MSRRPTITAAVLLAITIALLAPQSAAAADSRVGASFRYWDLEGGNDLRDPILWWRGGPLFAQLEYWDFEDPDARDHLRPELRLIVRDSRRSSYHVGWRHEDHRERLFLGAG